MNDISSRVCYNVLNICGEDDILDTREYNPNNTSIVVFDDLVNASDKTQNKIANHFTDERRCSSKIETELLTYGFISTNNKKPR